MVTKHFTGVSVYWNLVDFDIAYYNFYWDTEDSKSYLESKETSIITEYVKLAFKHGILMPSNTRPGDKLQNSISALLAKTGNPFPDGWAKFRFNRLYVFREKLLQNSALFTQRNTGVISLENIVNGESLLTFEDIVNDGSQDISAEPVKVIFLQDHLTISFHADALLYSLRNRKTEYNVLDNLSMAILNTPRFNSLLRDLKKLCFQFGATRSSSELMHDGFSENGILWEHEVLFYEDVIELIPF